MINSKSKDTNLQIKSWYLVYTKSRQEQIARDNLVNQGFEVYFPQIRKRRKRQGRRIDTVEPLFQRYLFIALNPESDNWAPIRSTLGVVSLVRFGQVPARIPESLVEFLREREDDNGLHGWEQSPYLAGDRVRVAEGAFRGYEGILLANNSRERVLVLLEILGRRIKARLDIAQIQRS